MESNESTTGADSGFDLDNVSEQLTGNDGINDETTTSDALPEQLADEVERHAEHMEEKHGERKQVPLAALQEERGRRQQVQAERDQLQQQLQAQAAQLQQYAAAMEQVRRAQLQGQQPPGAEQQEDIDFTSDPEGYIRAKEAMFEQRLNELQGQQQQAVQRAQLQQQVAHLAVNASAAEAQFRDEVGADAYNEAFKVVEADALNQLRQRFPGQPEEAYANLLAVATLQHAEGCFQQGRNPAQVIFERAQALGWKHGHRQVQRKQAPTSLATVSGERAPDERSGEGFTLDNVDAMSDTEFQRAWAAMEKASRQKPSFG